MTRILVIDDDAAVRNALEVLLSTCGYEVETAESGEEALTMLADTVFGVAIIDLCMPGLDGRQTVQRCKALAPDMPLILMSGLIGHGASGPSNPVLAGLEGTHQMSKPFKPNDLFRLLDTCLAGRSPGRSNSRSTAGSRRSVAAGRACPDMTE